MSTTATTGSEGDDGNGAGIGLPVDPGGSVYDPSTTQATKNPATALLRATPTPGDDVPASVEPASLAEHPPVPLPLHDPVQAVARLEFALDATGQATDITLIQGSGDTRLDAAILDVANSWAFEAARVNGEAVTSRLQLEVTLERDAHSTDSR